MLSKSGIDTGLQLNQTGWGVKTGLPIGTKLAGLVLAIFEGLLEYNHILQIFETPIVRSMQLLGEELRRGLPWPKLGAKAATKLEHDFNIALAVTGIDSLVHRTQEMSIATEMRHHNTLMFDRRRERKNQVAQSHDRWVHKDILRHVELELVQGLLPAFRRRSHACKGIRAEPIAHLILIDSVILFQAIERHVRQGTRTRSIPA